MTTAVKENTTLTTQGIKGLSERFAASHRAQLTELEADGNLVRFDVGYPAKKNTFERSALTIMVVSPRPKALKRMFPETFEGHPVVISKPRPTK